MKKTTTAAAAAQTFEANYERAGIINMTSRLTFANSAMALYAKSSAASQPTKGYPMQPVTLPDANAKPWYQSKAVIGGILAILLPLLSAIFPPLKLVSADSATDLILKLSPILGGILAIVGRVTASQPIAGTKAAEQAAAQAGGLVPSSILGMPLDLILRELPVVISALGDRRLAASPRAALGERQAAE